MKLKNILISFLTMFLMLFVTSVSAETTAPSTFTVNGSEQHRIDSSKYMPNNPWSFFYKQNSDGHIIYCVQSDHDAVTSGTKVYTLKGEIDAKFAYVMANGYPNKTITGNNEKDYFITALAVFYLVNPNDQYFNHYDLENGTYRGKTSDVVIEIAKLVNGAKNYSYTNPTIKINTNGTFTLSSDNKYYVSSNLTVNTSGNVSNYTVGLEGAPSSTIITDVNGNKKSTFNAGESFVIKVPVSSVNKLTNEFKVNVSAVGSVYKAYLYEPPKSKYQNTTALYPENIKISDTTTLKLNLTTKVEISKIDVTSGKELPGATLVIKNSNDEIIKTWVSSNKPTIIENLPMGKYTLTETLAPEGYVLSTETVTFEVKTDGSVTKVVMKNETNRVEISKIDATTGKELPGATLTVKDSANKIIDTWVSTNEVHVIRGLKPGKYTLTETIAPEGYVLSTETVTFEVKTDGNVTKVVMKNEMNRVEISKVDATTGKELPGATLTVKDSSDNVIDTWVSTNEVHVIRGLKPGKYTLTETIAPEGYVLSTETVTFEVKADGSVTKVVMENNPEKITPIYISKQDITTKEELAGAHLEIRDEEGNLIEAWVSKDTPHMIEELNPGKYFLSEVLAPEGYELSTEKIEFIVKDDGTVDGTIIMYNKPEEIVEVPSTASFKNITSSLIGIIVIGLGSMIIYRNYKKNEEY